MRVALLASGHAWRGSGTSLVNVARGLVGNGHTVQLLTTTPAVTARFAGHGLEPLPLPLHDTGLAAARILTSALRTLASDVLVVETSRDLRLGALVSLARRFALVYRHSLGHGSFPRGLIIRLAYRRAAMTLFLTHTAQVEARRIAPFMLRPPWRVIHEGVDVDRFRPDREAGDRFRERHGLGDGPFLLAVGALEHEKRYEWLLAALARLAPPVPPLVICGEGVLAPLIRQAASRLGLDVRLLGLLPPEELVAAYNAATCLVHACLVETFGLAVAEAMACGRPVLVAAGGALPEVVGSAGTLVASDDPGAFARAAAALLADPPRRAALGAAARERAVDAFSLVRMGREYASAVDAVQREWTRRSKPEPHSKQAPRRSGSRSASGS